MTSPPTLEFKGRVTLELLKQVLATLPRDKPCTDSNMHLVSSIGRPDHIVLILTDLLANKTALATTAERSYRHINHFDKIVLIDARDTRGYRLTLHLWRPPYKPHELDDELIHDHRFSFWSNILVGTLVSQNFDRATEGLPFRQYRYIPEKREELTLSNFYEFVGPARLTATSPSAEATGSSYYLNYERIHRVVLPRRDMVCTLVLRGPRERNYSNIYNTTYPTQDVQTGNVMFQPQELTEKLAALRDEILRKRA